MGRRGKIRERKELLATFLRTRFALFAVDQAKTKAKDRAGAISLATLLADFDRVDIIHCDVQGAEADVISAAMPKMATTVRRIVVGTHSRMIEHRYSKPFSSLGGGSKWRHPVFFKSLAVDPTF